MNIPIFAQQPRRRVHRFSEGHRRVDLPSFSETQIAAILGLAACLAVTGWVLLGFAGYREAAKEPGVAGAAAGLVLMAAWVGINFTPRNLYLAPMVLLAGARQFRTEAQSRSDESPFRWIAQTPPSKGAGALGAKPPANTSGAAPAAGAAKPDDDTRSLDALGGANTSVGLNLVAEAYRRGRFGIYDLEAAFDELPVLASGNQPALRGVDLQEMVKIILTRVSELRAQAQAAKKSTDLVYVNIRPQTQRCAAMLLRHEFASREAMQNLCEALEIPTLPDEGEASLVHKLNEQIARPGLAHLIATFTKDRKVEVSPQTQQLMAALQDETRGQALPAAQLAAANKRLLAEVFPAAFKKDQLEMDRAAVIIDLELAVSAESTDGVAFLESDFKDQALPEVARLIGVDLTAQEKGKERSDKEILEAINKRMLTGEWLKPFRNYLTGQRNVSELGSRLHNALIRYPHAQLFLGRRLLMEVLTQLFTRRPTAEAGYRDSVICPAYVADAHQLDLSHIPFHLNLTADGNRGFVRYMHAQQITLLEADGKGHRVDMGKPGQVERVSRDELGVIRPIGAPSTNRLEVDAVRMRAAKIILVLNQLHQKLLGVTQNQLLAGINELTPDERYYVEKLLQPIIWGTGEFNQAEFVDHEQAFTLGPLFGLATSSGESVESFLNRVNGALNDFHSITTLVRYCKSHDFYAKLEKPLREIERMRNTDKAIDEIAPRIKELIRQIMPDLFKREGMINLEDLLAGYADISSFLKVFLLQHPYVLKNLSEFVTGWQDTLSTELDFIQKAGAGYTRS